MCDGEVVGGNARQNFRLTYITLVSEHNNQNQKPLTMQQARGGQVYISEAHYATKSLFLISSSQVIGL
jgi:hypothetical protein